MGEENEIIDKKNIMSDNKIINKGPTIGVRHFQCFLLFFGLTFAYALRVNLSLAVVAMTDNSSNPDFPKYDWNEQQKSLILSSFFWGYVITQVPGGYLAQRIGGKMTVLVGVIISAILNLATPLLASWSDGWQLVCVSRVLQGLVQGTIYPSCHALLAKWSPIEERGRLGTWTYAGGLFGAVMMFGFSGYIAASSIGWPGIFYLAGGGGLLWSGVYIVLGASEPGDFKRISVEEKNYIEQSLTKFKNDDKQTKRNFVTPWGKFFTSLPFISLIVVHGAQNWGFWTLMTEIPSYLKGVLGQDIKNNALLSATPYLAMLIVSLMLPFLADFLTQQKLFSLTVSRKIFNSIGHWVPMIALIGLGYVKEGQTVLAVALLTLAVGINAATYLGFQINHIDLAPNFAGTMMGITNGVANIMSILGPLLVGVIVKDEHDATQWRIIFFIAAAFYFFGNLMFVIFGTAKTQTWNEPYVQPLSGTLPVGGSNSTSQTDIERAKY